MTQQNPGVAAKIIQPVADAALNQLDRAVDAVIAVADATQNATFESAAQVVSVGDKSADAAIAEIRTVKARLSGLLQDYVDAATSVLP